jgi:hypothetical protein
MLDNIPGYCFLSSLLLVFRNSRSTGKRPGFMDLGQHKIIGHYHIPFPGLEIITHCEPD